MTSLIHDISDTARWVAAFRAEESERPDAVFKDPFARRLAGEKGEQIANAIEFSRQNSWSFVARTFLFDQIIQQHLASGSDMIINLAAGLDARPYRLDLPKSLRWVEVDLPGILNYKETILANEKPNCQLRTFKLDLSERQARNDLFKELESESKKALIIAEGLIIYLKEQEVAELALDLSAQKSFRCWAFDLASPGLLAMAQKEMGSFLKQGNALLQFAPEEGEEFFQRYGWKPVESKSTLKTAAALNRLSPEMMNYAGIPEPEGPKGAFPWAGVCLSENKNS